MPAGIQPQFRQRRAQFRRGAPGKNVLALGAVTAKHVERQIKLPARRVPNRVNQRR